VSDHTGRRRRRSKLPIGRLIVLLVALAAVVRLLTLPDPARAPAAGGSPLTARPSVAPTWSGPLPVTIPGRLADGVRYLPRLYLNAETSVGIAPTPDERFLRVLLHAGGQVTELRRIDAEDHPEFDGFVASGETVVWAESLSRADEPVTTTIWRANWRSAGRPVTVTADAGFANFFGGQYDIVVRSGRVYWAPLLGGDRPVTEVRSVRLDGSGLTVNRLDGEFALSAWPWAVTPAAGRGTPAQLANLSTGRRVQVPTQADEVAVCGPTWCRTSVLDGDVVVRMDLVQVGGSERRRMAGSEATPTIADVAVLDRFVPLATDRADGGAGVGLSLYDIDSGRTDLVALDAANIQARNGVLWWSTGAEEELEWHAVDLRTLT
jgi:hypothetical protein